MALLTREQILSAPDLQYEIVSVPEWGGEVRVRGLTGAERDAYEKSLIEQRGNRAIYNPVNARARLVALCVVDEHGKRLFSDADVEAPGRKHAVALTRVWEVARRLSGLTAEAVEELEKNSESGQNDASTYD